VGHLKRCLRLARGLGSGVSLLTSAMDGPARAFLRAELSRWQGGGRPRLVERPQGRRWDMVVVDRRRTSAEQARELAGLGPCVFVDEGGEARAGAAFLIDTLPGPPGRSLPNISSPALLDLPPRRRRSDRPVRRVLVSFGGEDREDLSSAVTRLLVEKGFFPARQVTVVEGALFGRRAWPEGVRVRPAGGELRHELWRHDLLFTHFGVTAFEALASGVPVILVHPTPYHRLLGKTAGIPDAGLGRPRPASLRRLLGRPVALQARVEAFCRQIEPGRGASLAGLLSSLVPRVRGACPVCGEPAGTVTARFPDRTWRTCALCGVDWLEDFAERGRRYGKEYFFSEYRAQYGRTYLEDFDGIRALCAPRVRELRRILGERVRGAVVDVGCAYGPFLEELRQQGLAGFGVDVSADAVRHVRTRLGLPAATGAFETLQRGVLPRKIAAVTMWYVIEHFDAPGAALARAASLLEEGGVLAFSTPNGRGVSALSNRRLFLERSPFDHVAVFSPRGLARILARHGLRLVRVRVTGHHPERFPGALGRLAEAGKAGRTVVGWLSRALCLGDTFEAYAVKQRPPLKGKRGR
jgi:2-polyprenyl-3-methyl-5-hydroxy-6-metoxy-1,4-benzoquinol methylase